MSMLEIGNISNMIFQGTDTGLSILISKAVLSIIRSTEIKLQSLKIIHYGRFGERYNPSLLLKSTLSIHLVAI